VDPSQLHQIQTQQIRRDDAAVISSYDTSNVTGRHRGPKWKLWASYRVPSLKLVSHVAMHFHRGSGIVRFVCAMRVFDVRAPSSSPRLPMCQNLFLLQPLLLTYTIEKLCTQVSVNQSINQSINHSLNHPAYLMPQNRSKKKLYLRSLVSWMQSVHFIINWTDWRTFVVNRRRVRSSYVAGLSDGSEVDGMIHAETFWTTCAVTLCSLQHHSCLTHAMSTIDVYHHDYIELWN